MNQLGDTQLTCDFCHTRDKTVQAHHSILIDGTVRYLCEHHYTQSLEAMNCVESLWPGENPVDTVRWNARYEQTLEWVRPIFHALLSFHADDWEAMHVYLDEHKHGDEDDADRERLVGYFAELFMKEST